MTGGGLAIANQAVEGPTPAATPVTSVPASPTPATSSPRSRWPPPPLTGNQWVGPVVRAQAGGQDLYVGIYFWDNGNPELMLFLRDNGNWSQLGAATTSPRQPGTTLSLTAVGSTLASP